MNKSSSRDREQLQKTIQMLSAVLKSVKVWSKLCYLVSHTIGGYGCLVMAVRTRIE